MVFKQSLDQRKNIYLTHNLDMNIQRILITLGIILVIVGLIWPLVQKSGLGRLPGDIAIEQDKFRFYFPITTSIILSIIVTLIIWLFRR